MKSKKNKNSLSITIMLIICISAFNVRAEEITKTENSLANKEKSSEENTFEKLDEIINDHNKLYEVGNTTWKMGHNQFSNWTEKEFREFLYIEEEDMQGRGKSITSELKVPSGWKPTSLNLTVDNIPVKHQKKCKCCSAYAGVGVIEYNLWKKYGKYEDLSEQNVYDCATKGLTKYSYEYYLKNGILYEENYPFTGKAQECNRTGTKNAKIFKDGPKEYFTLSKNETVIAYALHKKGWISVPINGTVFRSYQGGIIRKKDCGSGINHAVIIVGYGTDKSTGIKYWLIKNSWGPNWGENGYVRIERGVNCCGILAKYNDMIYLE